jgi:hypothetical protein
VSTEIKMADVARNARRVGKSSKTRWVLCLQNLTEHIKSKGLGKGQNSHTYCTLGNARKGSHERYTKASTVGNMKGGKVTRVNAPKANIMPKAEPRRILDILDGRIRSATYEQ